MKDAPSFWPHSSRDKDVIMPFKSEAQRRLLWAKHPEIAKRWAHEYPGQHDLPYRAKKKKGEKKGEDIISIAATMMLKAAGSVPHGPMSRTQWLAAPAEVPYPDSVSRPEAPMDDLDKGRFPWL